MFGRRRSHRSDAGQGDIESLPLVGDTIALPDGSHIQKPHPGLVAALQSRDSRLRYYPINEAAIASVDGRYVFYRGTEGLAGQILQDFPGPHSLAMRGLALSLRGRFQHFSPEEAAQDIDKWGLSVGVDDHREMSDVITVLETGTDRKGFLGHIGGMGQYNGKPELNVRSHEWMYQHWESETAQCVTEGRPEDAKRLFPSLLLYDSEMLKDYTCVNPEALLAVYVMDRVIIKNHVFADTLLGA